MLLQGISILIVAIFVILAIKSWKDPGIALGLVWCMYAMEQVLQQGNSFLLSNSSFLNIAIAGIASVSVIKTVLANNFKGTKPPRELWLALAMYGFCVISLAWVPDFSTSKHWLITCAPYLLTFVIVAPFCATSPLQLAKAYRVLLYFGFVILAGLSLCSISNRGIVLTELIGGRRIDANPLATASFGGYVALAAIFTIYGTKSNKKGFVFFFHLFICALALYTIARSGSRGQMVGVVLAAFLWLPITARIAAKRSSILAIGLAAVVTIGMIYYVMSSEHAIRWSWNTVETSTFGRIEMSQVLLERYARSGPMAWLFGLGSSASFKYIGFYPHVVAAEVLGEEGLVGLFLFLAFVVVALSQGYRMISSPKIDVAARVNLGLLLALFTFEFALSFKQGSLLGSSPMYGFGVTVGWYINVLKRQDRRITMQQQYAQAQFRQAEMLRPDYRHRRTN